MGRLSEEQKCYNNHKVCHIQRVEIFFIMPASSAKCFSVRGEGAPVFKVKTEFISLEKERDKEVCIFSFGNWKK